MCLNTTRVAWPLPVSRGSFPTAMGAAGLEYVPALVTTAPASWLRISKGQGGASKPLLGKWGVDSREVAKPSPSSFLLWDPEG